MKRLFFLLTMLATITACNREADLRYNAEISERIAILKSEIAELPSTAPVRFYWVPGSFDSPVLAASCAAAEVRFETPYLLANGVRFNVYDWQSTQNYINNHNGPKIDSSAIRFWQR